MLTNSLDDLQLSLRKIDNTGALEWTVEYNTPGLFEQGLALTILSGGAILIAGWVGDLTADDGQLLWFDAEGNLLQALVIDGPAMDDRDYFYDVAAAPAGDHAVAVGRHRPDVNNSDLWIYKFEI